MGVAIDSLADMGILFRDIPLADVSTSMTINSTAAILLSFYVAVAEEQGCPPGRLRGTIQNDILKEYMARGTYIFPPEPSLRLITDLMAYCHQHVPLWNTISIKRVPHPGSRSHRRSGGSPLRWPMQRPTWRRPWRLDWRVDDFAPPHLLFLQQPQ